ncbi:uncharacterized protein LOC106072977 [Biomphalaria glabrata]|uniref:Uncharacterized protein LOC106072977 n=1 Tax=Biomphalaria glabrata TaxID=6526 RepID=A0A9U8EJ53_BIOGL|nr:uncharacterized protein LOC106072977 [Biomphalaria glabrata]
MSTEMYKKELLYLKGITSIFNVKDDDLPKAQLAMIRDKIEQEIEEDESNKEEEVHRRNLCTWLEYVLGEYNKAKLRNDEVMALTKNLNVTALTGRAWIAWETGDRDIFNASLTILEECTSSDSAELLEIESKAQIAYCFCRLQFPYYLEQGLKMYSEIVQKHPENYNCMLGLGLAHRREINLDKSAVAKHAKQVAKYFCTVIRESGDTVLKRQAYVQVVSLKQLSDQKELGLDGMNELFQKTFEELLEEALAFEKDSADPKSLAILGTTLRKHGDIDRAIVILKQSLRIKPLQLTYFNLGKCYETFQPYKTARNEMNRKAIDMYQNSLELSYRTNYIVVYEIGRLYRLCGDYDLALEQFQTLISESQSMIKHKYLFQLSSAFLLSALCLMEKSRHSLYSNELKARIERFLLQSINVANDLPYYRDTAVSFMLKKLKNSGHQIPYELRELQYFRNSADHLLQTLQRYLRSRMYENAYTFVKVYGSQIPPWQMTELLETLMMKVKLYTAADRLERNETTVHMITKPLFDSSLGARCELDKVIDVLLLSDSESLEKLKFLRNILTEKFGLDVDTHRDSDVPLSTTDTARYKVLLVLASSNEKSRHCLELLNPSSVDRPGCYNEGTQQANILIGLLDDEVEINPPMAQYPQQIFKLLHNPGETSAPSGNDVGHHSTGGQQWADDVNALMSIYCFLIGQPWPI